MQDFAKEKLMEQQLIEQRYNKIFKEMKARHEREILSLSGGLKNSGGGSPKRRLLDKVK